MKKLLILAAALLGFSAAQAQFAPEPVNQPTEQITWLTPQQVKAQAVEATALDAPSMESLANEQSLRAYVNPGTSVWYQKPKGTLSYTFTSTSSGNPKCAYIVAPMFLPLTFINKYATPEEATWINSSGTTLTADANFNYRTSYPKPASSTSAWYAPLITAETDTFRFGGSFVTANSRALVVGTLDVRTAYTVDRNEGYYNGFTNYTYYGTNSNSTNPTTTVKQYMEAPVAPMWVEDIWFHYCSKGDTLGALQNGATVTFTIYSLATPNSMTGATELFTTEITEANIDSKNPNSANTQTTGSITIPVGKVIEGPYAIVLDGFNREGVNFGVYMAKLDNTADFYGRGGVYPTLVTRVDPETGEVLGDYYQYNATNGTQYNAVFALDMLWDVAYVNTGYLHMTAPAEGGNLQMVSSGTTYNGIAVRTSNIWDEGGYTIEDMPEWLTLTTHTDADYYANNNCYTILNFDAAPNYTGETRTATVRIRSEKGAKSQDVTITQEAAEMPDVYILGEVGENIWATNVGQKMELDEETNLYTAEIACDGRNDGYNFFKFSTQLLEEAADWDGIAPYLFGAVAEPNENNPDGNFLVTDEMLGIDLSLTKDNGKAFQIPAGTYNLTLNYADMKLKIEKAVAPGMPGDANEDGKVDVNDVTTIINYILQKNPTPFNFDNANVNGDDTVDVMDVTLIIDMILHPNA
ncbi:MAG: hypothetical protein J5523_00725 [Muribaculaceae bacterium]|nr:hypothetical protein [Muribaculaceae bacterium]